jgi:hypothetical protein
MRSKSAIIICFLFLISGFQPVFLHAGEKTHAVPGYKFKTCTKANIESLIKQTETEKTELTSRLEKKYQKKPKKVFSNAAYVAYEQIGSSLERLLQKLEDGDAPADLKAEFQKIQRLHYTTRADILEIDMPLLVQIIHSAPNYLLGSLLLGVPKVADLNEPIGQKRAEAEAAKLFKRGSSKLVSRKELAEMSALEISRLEPSSRHSAICPHKPGNHYSTFVKRILSGVRKAKSKYKKFNLPYARRVMVLDKIKTSATSPKIRCKDRYGIKWGLKWGEEVHADVIATRLYIDMGGRYSDLKFYSGPGETLVILPKKDDLPQTYEEFEKAMLESQFKFHANRYLLPSPQIKDNQGRILGSGQITKSVLEQNDLDPKYLNCYYLLFKECQLVFNNPCLKRLGGIALNKGGALSDRVARSTLIFNTWIGNPDFKEDNARGGLLYNPKTKQFDILVEYISDLGASFFGKKMTAGDFSTFSPSFIRNGWKKTHLKLRTFYHPKAWDNCTYSDARWMAKRIAGLSRADYERVFAESGLPAFMQKLGIEKLISRRNELVKTFSLGKDGLKAIPCNPKFDFYHRQSKEYLIKKGKVNGRSKTIRKLEKDFHPEGFAHMRNRMTD